MPAGVGTVSSIKINSHTGSGARGNTQGKSCTSVDKRSSQGLTVRDSHVGGSSRTWITTSDMGACCFRNKGTTLGSCAVEPARVSVRIEVHPLTSVVVCLAGQNAGVLISYTGLEGSTGNVHIRETSGKLDLHIGAPSGGDTDGGSGAGSCCCGGTVNQAVVTIMSLSHGSVADCIIGVQPAGPEVMVEIESLTVEAVDT